MRKIDQTAGNCLVDPPTQLICISDINFCWQIQTNAKDIADQTAENQPTWIWICYQLMNDFVVDLLVLIFRLTWFGDNTIFCHSDVSSLSPLLVAPVWSVFTLPLICTLRMGLLSPAPFSQLLWTQNYLFWQLNQKPPQRLWRRNKPSWFGTDSRHPLHLVETNILNSKCIQLTYIFRKVYSEI